jgi:hypothetical protein
MSSTDEAPWYFDSYSPGFTRFTAVAAVLMPVVLVFHLLTHKTGEPTFTSLTVLLIVMALVWPIQLLRIRSSRRWEQHTILNRITNN